MSETPNIQEKINMLFKENYSQTLSKSHYINNITDIKEISDDDIKKQFGINDDTLNTIKSIVTTSDINFNTDISIFSNYLINKVLELIKEKTNFDSNANLNNYISNYPKNILEYTNYKNNNNSDILNKEFNTYYLNHIMINLMLFELSIINNIYNDNITKLRENKISQTESNNITDELKMAKEQIEKLQQELQNEKQGRITDSNKFMESQTEISKVLNNVNNNMGLALKDNKTSNKYDKSYDKYIKYKNKYLSLKNNYQI